MVAGVGATLLSSIIPRLRPAERRRRRTRLKELLEERAREAELEEAVRREEEEALIRTLSLLEVEDFLLGGASFCLGRHGSFGQR